MACDLGRGVRGGQADGGQTDVAVFNGTNLCLQVHHVPTYLTECYHIASEDRIRESDKADENNNEKLSLLYLAKIVGKTKV